MFRGTRLKKDAAENRDEKTAARINNAAFFGGGLLLFCLSPPLRECTMLDVERGVIELG